MLLHRLCLEPIALGIKIVTIFMEAKKVIYLLEIHAIGSITPFPDETNFAQL